MENFVGYYGQCVMDALAVIVIGGFFIVTLPLSLPLFLIGHFLNGRER